MTAYPPQPPVRKLTRSRSNKMLGGVCSGVATYLNMDVTLVRILTVVLSLFTGIPIIAYIVCLLVVPEEEQSPYAGPQRGDGPETTPPAPQPGADPVWGAGGAPWDQTSGTAPASPAPSPEPGPAPRPAPTPDPIPEPESTPEPQSTPEPGPVAADPVDSQQVGSPDDSEPLTEEPPVVPAPGEESSWESTPADPEHKKPTD